MTDYIVSRTTLNITPGIGRLYLIRVGAVPINLNKITLGVNTENDGITVLLREGPVLIGGAGTLIPAQRKDRTAPPVAPQTLVYEDPGVAPTGPILTQVLISTDSVVSGSENLVLAANTDYLIQVQNNNVNPLSFSVAIDFSE